MPNPSRGGFDLIVIGGGPAGSSIAEGCASAGMRVALVEADQLGGTCLNYGCDPMNKMIRTGEVLRVSRSADRFGIYCPEVRLDWPALREQIAAMIDELRGGDGVQALIDAGIEVIHGKARFVSVHEIDVEGRLFSAERFVIATGSQVVAPDIDGLVDAGFLTNTDVFNLERLPASLVILGEDSNAIEFAQVYLNFGLDVTLATDQPRILPREDEDVAGELEAILRRDGVVIRTQCDVESVRMLPNGQKRIVLRDAEGVAEVEAEDILLATGRKPRIDDLGLDAAGVVWTREGIDVDASMQTSASHIWAVGDVTGRYHYTHTALYQAEIAVEHILQSDSRRQADDRVIPRKVFTQPELASVGLTEQEARSGGHDVVTSTMAYKDLPRALTLAERDGLVKLVVDPASLEVLGGHVLGARASEVIAQIALVMQHRLPVSTIGDTLHTHPTMGEGVYWAARNLIDILQDENERSTSNVSA